MDKARETKKKRRRGLARVYHPRHGDTSLMVVMAPFRDELSHGQWFRETPPPPPSFTKTGRVKSSLRLAQDREHSEIVVTRSLSLSLSLATSFKSGSWNMQRTIIVVYQFHRARKSRDSPSLQRVVPYHGEHRGRPPTREPSSLPFSLHFRLYSLPSTSFASFHSCSVGRSGRGRVVQSARSRIRGVQWKEEWRGKGKSGPAAEDDVRVKWLRYRILADAICAIPSVQRNGVE